MPVPFTCPHCGHQTLVQDQYVGQSGPCAGCGQTVTVLPPGAVPPPSSIDELGENPGIRLLLPVGRSFWAIAAGYAGLFAVLFIPAPFALILGIIAIYDIKRHPKRHGMGRAIFGLVMGAIFTIGLILAIVGCVAAGVG
jgi:hypothetical protein